MLNIDRLSAWYGEAQALREVSMQVERGEIVTLVGSSPTVTLARRELSAVAKTEMESSDGLAMTTVPPSSEIATLLEREARAATSGGSSSPPPLSSTSPHAAVAAAIVAAANARSPRRRPNV